jgi:triacylglycerol esterase/lipase EstA (alpha/beta hydrolase family)
VRSLVRVLEVLAAGVAGLELLLLALRRYELAGSGNPATVRPGPLGFAAAVLGQYASSLLLAFLWPFGLLWPFPPRSSRGSLPVVLVHGYGGTRANLFVLGWRLRRAGFEVFGVNYPPFGGTFHSKARRLAAAIERILARTGADRIDVVAHSLGGLVARAWIRAHGRESRVRRLVTLGTPHQGTRVAALAVDPLAKALLPGSRELAELSRDDPVPSLVSVTAIYSTFDAKVLPPRNGYYPGAWNIEVDGIGHDALLFSPKVARLVVEALRESDRPS